MASNRTEIQQARNELVEAERLGQPEHARAAAKRLRAAGVKVSVPKQAKARPGEDDAAARLVGERTADRTATDSEKIRKAAEEVGR